MILRQVITVMIVGRDRRENDGPNSTAWKYRNKTAGCEIVEHEKSTHAIAEVANARHQDN